MGNGKSKSSDLSIGSRQAGEYMQTDIDFVSDMSNKFPYNSTEYLAMQQLDMRPWEDEDLKSLFSTKGDNPNAVPVHLKYNSDMADMNKVPSLRYPESSYFTTDNNSVVPRAELFKARNLAVKYAYNIFREMRTLGIIDSSSKVTLNFTGTTPRGTSVWGTEWAPSLGAPIPFFTYIDIFGQNVFKSIDDTGSKNWSTSKSYRYGTVALSTVHEIGHAFDDYATRKLGLNKPFSSTILGTRAVSTYGNSNNFEAFAESFVIYACGLKTTGKSDYHKNFVKAMKDNGFDSIRGCAARKIPKSVTKNFKYNKKVSGFDVVFDRDTKKLKMTGSIGGKEFSHTITGEDKRRGYILKVIGSIPYQIDINSGNYLGM